MRKPAYLLLLSFGVFLPLIAFAQQAETTTTIDVPADQQKQVLELLVKGMKARQDKATADKLAAVIDPKTGEIKDPDAANALIQQLTTAQAPKPDPNQASKDEAKRAVTNVTTWGGLQKLIPNIKVVYDYGKTDDRGGYTTSVHLSGSIPRNCAAMIGDDGRDENSLFAIYDGTTKNDSLEKDTPFRGWSFQSSQAAEDCVKKTLNDKGAAYCNSSNQDCIKLGDSTKISNLAKGPKIGFYSCDADDAASCSVSFFNLGKSDSDVKRVADKTVYDSAMNRIKSAGTDSKYKLSIWKIKNNCYRDGKNSGIDKLISEVGALKGHLKTEDDLSPYIKNGLNAEIKRRATVIDGLIQKGDIDGLAAYSQDVLNFYQKYLASNRSEVKDMDMDLLRKDTLALFRKMERGVLDGDKALKNIAGAKAAAETIISNALVVAPDDLALKNELDAGIKIDVLVLQQERKSVALNTMIKQCQQNPQGCDQVRLNAAITSFLKSNQQAGVYYDKLRTAATKACASGKSKSKDPFDDEGLVIEGTEDGGNDDAVEFASRCDAAKDNLNRVWRRLQDENNAARSVAGAANPQIVRSIATAILCQSQQNTQCYNSAQRGLPNATVQQGQLGYNPALAYAMNPNKFPDDFSSQTLQTLAGIEIPSANTALGTGMPGMCTTVTGQSFCPQTQQVPALVPGQQQQQQVRQVPVQQANQLPTGLVRIPGVNS